MTLPAVPRPASFRWYICGLLLLATTINYMDRQTLSAAAVRIKADFRLSNEQYGEVETSFGLAFAVGSLVFGFLADRVSVRWLYPALLVAWSAMGVATGSVTGFLGLLTCRALLGLFEAGHWPCALRTTQRLLPPEQRTLGNSILQSGSSIGAIITPLLMAWLLTPEQGSWRFAFQVIGVVGFGWAVLWLSAVRASDLAARPASDVAEEIPRPALTKAAWLRRFVVLTVVVVAINTCWHFFRVWLPLFLQEGRHYEEKFTLGFVSAFYVATDVGCLAAGWATVALGRRGCSTDLARWLVFACCAGLTALSVPIAFLAAGPGLLALLSLLAAGALGLFPCYYSLSQELSSRHQGKITGLLGAIAWLSALLHKYFGRFVDQYHSYDLGLAVVGLLPLVAAVVWWFVWDWPTDEAT